MLLRCSSVLVLFAFVCCVLAHSQNDRVLMKEVSVVTLHRGQMTTGRRVAAVPQLHCVGGCSQEGMPDVAQCKNVGWDGSDAQWECEAELDSQFRFGEVTVLCEGYEYPEDEYILKGSCGLEYTLIKSHTRAQDTRGYNYGSASQGNNMSMVVYLIIGAIVLFAMYALCIGGRGNTQNSQSPIPQYARPTGYAPGYASPRPYSSNYGYGGYNRRSMWGLGGLAAGAGYLGSRMYGGRTSHNSYNSHSNSHSATRPHTSSSGPSARPSTGYASTSRR